MLAGQYTYAHVCIFMCCMCMYTPTHIWWSLHYQASYSRGHGTERIIDQPFEFELHDLLKLFQAEQEAKENRCIG